jgi:hypothetical protein
VKRTILGPVSASSVIRSSRVTGGRAGARGNPARRSKRWISPPSQARARAQRTDARRPPARRLSSSRSPVGLPDQPIKYATVWRMAYTKPGSSSALSAPRLLAMISSSRGAIIVRLRTPKWVTFLGRWQARSRGHHTAGGLGQIDSRSPQPSKTADPVEPPASTLDDLQEDEICCVNLAWDAYLMKRRERLEGLQGLCGRETERPGQRARVAW